MTDSKTGIDYTRDRWEYDAGVECREVDGERVTEVWIVRRPRNSGGPKRYAIFAMPGLDEEQRFVLQQGLRSSLRKLHIDDRTAVRDVGAAVRRKADGKDGCVEAVDRVNDTLKVFGEHEPADNFELSV